MSAFGDGLCEMPVKCQVPFTIDRQWAGNLSCVADYCFLEDQSCTDITRAVKDTEQTTVSAGSVDIVLLLW